MSDEIAPTQVETPSVEPQQVGREDLIAAAQAAMESEGAEIVEVDAPAETEHVEQAVKKNKLFDLLREREDAFKQRKQYNVNKRNLDSEQQYIQKTKAEIEAERAKLSKLKQSPLEAFRELGWTAEDIQRAVLEDGTPEGREKAKYRSELDEVRSKTQQLEALIKQQQEWQEQQRQEAQRQQATAQRQEVVNTFLQITNKESCPNLHLMYPDDETRIKYGDFVANQYFQRTGKHITTQKELQDLSEYMESEAERAIDKLIHNLQEKGSLQDRIKKAVGKQVSVSGSAPKAKANGSHTLRASDASQRKTQPMSLDGMHDSDARAYLISVAEEAMRNER